MFLCFKNLVIKSKDNHYSKHLIKLAEEKHLLIEEDINLPIIRLSLCGGFGIILTQQVKYIKGMKMKLEGWGV